MTKPIGAKGIDMRSIDHQYVQIPHQLRHLVSEGAYMTYAVILETAWGPGEQYYRGREQLAQDRGVALRTIQRHLEELEAAGVIEIKQRGRRQHNLMTVLEWDAICVEGDGSSVTHHREGDRSPVAHHLNGDGSSMTRVTGHQWPVPREEDDLKKTTYKQEDDLQKQEDDSGLLSAAQYRPYDADSSEPLYTDGPEPLYTEGPEDEQAEQPAPLPAPVSLRSTSAGLLEEERPQAGAGSSWWVDGEVLGFSEGVDEMAAFDLEQIYQSILDGYSERTASLQAQTVQRRHPHDLGSALAEMTAVAEDLGCLPQTAEAASR